MALDIRPYTADAVPAVREFNRRLLAGGAPADQQFPESPDPGWMPGLELFLAMEGEAVRGGYILRRQRFTVHGESIGAAHYRLPLSEGIVDRAYAMVALRLVRDALAREPRLYALGMGGWDRPLPQMLKSLKWRMSEVPFRFKVVRPGPFLRNIRVLRTNAVRRAALDLAALTGAGWLGMKAAGIARRLPSQACDPVDSFGSWADDLWRSAHAAYGLVAKRDAATLRELYPASDSRFFRVRAAGGWAVCLDTQMHDHKQFGDMRVGTIVDCFGPTDSAGKVMLAAASLLERRGVDLIVSNQSHPAWIGGLTDAGCRGGPSNYLVALSPKLAEAAGEANMHFNRGDGDGPIHL